MHSPRNRACGSPPRLLWPVRRRKLPRAQARQRRFARRRRGHRGQPSADEACRAARLLAAAVTGGRGRLVGFGCSPRTPRPGSICWPTAPPARSMPSRDPTNTAVTGGSLHADRLAAALDLDMAEWWQPTAESYLGRVSKARILMAVAEGASPKPPKISPGSKRMRSYYRPKSGLPASAGSRPRCARRS